MTRAAALLALAVAVAALQAPPAHAGWSAPVEVDKAHGPARLTSVSCPSARFCVAVDTRGQAFTYDGARWSSPTTVDRLSFPGLTSVSCASASFCVATDAARGAFIYRDGTWTGPVDVASDPYVGDLSCPQRDFCAASAGDSELATYSGAG